MRLTTYYIPSSANATGSPGFVPISGDYSSVDEAYDIAVGTAVKNPRFTSWCVAFDIENDGGEVVASWSQDDVASERRIAPGDTEMPPLGETAKDLIASNSTA